MDLSTTTTLSLPAQMPYIFRAYVSTDLFQGVNSAEEEADSFCLPFKLRPGCVRQTVSIKKDC